MNYDYYENTACQDDQLSGIGSSNPTLSSLQEILLVYLSELAYYLLELKKLGASNEIIRNHIIDAISGIITNIDYNHDQFRKLLVMLVQDLSQTKSLYDNLTKKNNIEPKFIKSCFKSSYSFRMSEIIKRGEKYFIKRNNSYSSEQKNLVDLMVLIIKRFCLKIIQIKSYKKSYELAYEVMLKLLNNINFEEMNIAQMKSEIENAIREYHKLIQLLYDLQEEAYGKRESVCIPFSPRNGKAILVSGVDMTQLQAVLEATKDRGIDVYTHGMTMLMAHTLPKFREYSNLVGHFGKGSDNSLLDFAAFPGAILMTKFLFQKVEYLYRGKLFTTDSFAPNGIAKIENNDFEPLIKAAIETKGFTKAQQKIIQRVGFRQKFIENEIPKIVEKMEKNEIKHLYFIGILHNWDAYQEYFNQFFKIMPKDCYAISLDHEKNEENVLHVDAFYDYLLIYKVLDEFSKKKPLSEFNITIYMTKCDQYTATNVINFINMGVKHVFLCKCLPTIISPALAETIRKTFGVEDFSTPEEDIKKTLTQGGSY